MSFHRLHRTPSQTSIPALLIVGGRDFFAGLDDTYACEWCGYAADEPHDYRGAILCNGCIAEVSAKQAWGHQ